MIAIGKLLNYVLSNISGLTVTGIYPIIAPEKTELPFIVFERDSVNPLYTKDGLVGNETGVTIYLLSNDYTQSIDFADKIRLAFERQKISYSGITVNGCDLISCDEAFNDYAYIQKLTFQFKTN